MKFCKKAAAWLALGLAFSFCVTGLSACGGKEQAPDLTEAKPQLKAITPADGKLVVLSNEEIAAFTENYVWNLSGEFAVQGQDHFSMKPLTLKWEGGDEGDDYEVVLATKADLSDGVKYTADSNSLSVKDLFVSTQYYWQVICTTAGKEEHKSAIHSFKTVTTPRTVDIRGVSNTRDLGGYPTESGKYVRQGMAYRGATLDSIGEEGIEDALVKYGIKTELDVRNASESLGRTESSFGEGAQYYSYSCPYYLGDHGLNIDKSQYPEEIENLAKAIKVFAVEDNYPIYYHCSLGRDRTGMVAMLLQGLLGVPRDYIYMDYEVSFFSERGCYDFAGNNPKLKVGHMMDSLTGVYNYIDAYGETEGPLPFATNCEKYLQDIGVTETEIASIRNLLLTE
ncbi:MAG: tyrosine-protein phosphatase [Clostridia bacterium]|nr:tyrosine-protein phosphatase [Clostridia bacterium]